MKGFLKVFLSTQCTEVRFASFLSSRFTTVTVINPRKETGKTQPKRTSVQCGEYARLDSWHVYSFSRFFPVGIGYCLFWTTVYYWNCPGLFSFAVRLFGKVVYSGHWIKSQDVKLYHTFFNLPIVHIQVRVRSAKIPMYKFQWRACWINRAPEYKLTEIFVKM